MSEEAIKAIEKIKKIEDVIERANERDREEGYCLLDGNEALEMIEEILKGA